MFSSLKSSADLASFASANSVQVITGTGVLSNSSSAEIFEFGIHDFPVYSGSLSDRLAYFEERHETMYLGHVGRLNVLDPARSTSRAATDSAIASATFLFSTIEVLGTNQSIEALLGHADVEAVIMGKNNGKLYKKALEDHEPVPMDLNNIVSPVLADGSTAPGASDMSTFGTSTTGQQAFPTTFNWCGPTSPLDDRCPMDEMWAPSLGLWNGSSSFLSGLYQGFSVPTLFGTSWLEFITVGGVVRWGTATTTAFTGTALPYPNLAFRGDLEPKCNLVYVVADFQFECGQNSSQTDGLFVENSTYEAEAQVVDSQCTLPQRTGTFVDYFLGCFHPGEHITNLPDSYLDTTISDAGDRYRPTVGTRSGELIEAGKVYEWAVIGGSWATSPHVLVNSTALDIGQIGSELNQALCDTVGAAFCVINLDTLVLGSATWQ